MNFTKKNYKWTLDGLRQCMEENSVESEIIAYNDNAAIVRVKNYEDSKILGATSDWCITQYKTSWEEYVGKNNRIQLFFYYFGKCRAFEQLVGATFEYNKDTVQLYCCFGKNNHPIKEYYDCFNLNDLDALNHFILNRFFNLSFSNEVETILGNSIAKIGEEMEQEKIRNEEVVKERELEEFWREIERFKNTYPLDYVSAYTYK